jgi:hypothetical protein
LWGDQCDEAAAALFVATLRAAGLRVWMVAISGKRIGGVHGLQLVADLALDQALPLADDAICVIAPCPAETLVHFLHDPRLHTFLERITLRGIPLFLAPSPYGKEQPKLLLDLALPIGVLTCYPPGEALLPFIHTLAADLT